MTEAAPQAPVSRRGLLLGLGAVVLGVWLAWTVPGLGREALVGANERAAIDALRQIVFAEREWKSRDGDGNALPDFWTADVSGLHRAFEPPAGRDLPLHPDIAAADAFPLPPTSGDRPRVGPAQSRGPYRGYWFRALKKADGRDLAADGPDTDALPWENRTAFAFAAYPAEPGKSGRRTFIVREDGSVRGLDIGGGGAALEAWPDNLAMWLAVE